MLNFNGFDFYNNSTIVNDCFVTATVLIIYPQYSDWSTVIGPQNIDWSTEQ